MDLRTKFDQDCSVNVLQPSSYIQRIKSELRSVSKRKNLLHKSPFCTALGFSDTFTRGFEGRAAQSTPCHGVQSWECSPGLRRRRQLPGTASPSLSSPSLRELELSRHLQAGEATGPKAPEWLLLPPHGSPAMGAAFLQDLQGWLFALQCLNVL